MNILFFILGIVFIGLCIFIKILKNRDGILNATFCVILIMAVLSFFFSMAIEVSNGQNAEIKKRNKLIIIVDPGIYLTSPFTNYVVYWVDGVSDKEKEIAKKKIKQIYFGIGE